MLQYPAAVTELCGFFAERVRADDGSSLVDVVCGPTTGGVILAFETARQLGVRGIFAEEVRDEEAPRTASSGAASGSSRASESCWSTTS